MNRTIYADDCLNILNDEIEIESGSIDLIYLDPPFNSKSKYTLPFKAKDKSARPAEVFVDTWNWDEKEQSLMDDFGNGGPSTKNIFDIITLVRRMESPRVKYSTAAYLVNMAARLIPMKRVLKPTGSIYLHCDPSAGHYLKLLMDIIFGKENFRNEIVWHYRRWTGKAKKFQQLHDLIYFYSKTTDYQFNQLYTEYTQGSKERKEQGVLHRFKEGDEPFLVSNKEVNEKGVPENDVWQIPFVAPSAKERLGYPTQKPFALVDRIIKASSNSNDIVLDPFCGCGTAIHAAEANGRQWMGIDISHFSAGLMRNRILSNFKHLSSDDIQMTGVPGTPQEARELARADKFAFEKWVCGHVGAEGMFHEPGQKGADGGVDGVLKFVPTYMGEKPKSEYAIVQVKGGNVTPDAVRALSETIDRFDARAGIVICFNDQMQTVENNRSKRVFRDSVGEYPVIQGLSVEDMLRDCKLNLPPILKKAA